jgi:hypothetical protein
MLVAAPGYAAPNTFVTALTVLTAGLLVQGCAGDSGHAYLRMFPSAFGPDLPGTGIGTTAGMMHHRLARLLTLVAVPALILTGAAPALRQVAHHGYAKEGAMSA